MNTPPIRPSTLWYWISGALIAAGIAFLVGGVASGIASLSGQLDEFQRSPLPGQNEVSFTEAGDYVLYYEGIDTSGSFYALLVPVGGETMVPIDDYPGSMTYNIGGRSGVAVGTFRIDEPGTYLLRTSTDGPPGTVAVGPALSGAILAVVGVSLLGATLLTWAGTGLAIHTGIRRSRAQRLPPAQPWPQATDLAPYPKAAPTTPPAGALPPGLPTWRTPTLGGIQPGSVAPFGVTHEEAARATVTGTNGYAVAALVLGLIGWFPLGLSFGVIALREIRRGQGRGRGMAIAGVLTATGWALLTALIAVVVLLIVRSAA